MKRVTAMLLCLALAFSVTACTSNQTNSQNQSNEAVTTTSAVTTETVTEDLNSAINDDATVKNSKLATQQQKILSTGVNKNGDIYEIVCNVNETYQGSELLVGVIKNSKWLIKPNNKCPFINKERWGWDNSGRNLEQLKCGYLNNGTFYNLRKGSSSNPIYEGYLELWNVETNKYLYLEDVSASTVEDYNKLGFDKNDKLF